VKADLPAAHKDRARRIAAKPEMLRKSRNYFAGSNDAGGASNCGWLATGGGSKTSGCDRGNVHLVKLAVTTTISHAIFNRTLLIVRDHLLPGTQDSTAIDLR
jgi:hypothetical protein